MSNIKFEFDQNELASPTSFLKTIDRALKFKESLGPNDSLDISKFINQATNVYDYDGDEWFDLVFDIGNKDNLKNFTSKITEANNILNTEKNITLMPSIITMAASSTPHVQTLLNTKPEPPKIHGEHTVSASLMM